MKRYPPVSNDTKVSRTELTPVSFLRRSAHLFPDKLAVVRGPRRYSYAQFEERVNRLASGLRAAGLAKHDRVAFLCQQAGHAGRPLRRPRRRWHLGGDQPASTATLGTSSSSWPRAT